MNTNGIEKSCVGCRHYLGGGQCRINVEAECREGGGFELWEPPEEKRTRLESVCMWSSIVLTALAYPLVLYRLYEWAVYFIKK